MQLEKNHKIMTFQPNILLRSKYCRGKVSHSKKWINQLIERKRKRIIIVFEDIQCISLPAEWIKRFYWMKEWKKKLRVFQQYYFYHLNCPRICSHDLEMVIQKWHNRRRDYIQKHFNNAKAQKNEQKMQEQISQNSSLNQFLLNISEYNPFSKKYYLRAQPRQQQKYPNTTEKELQKLNHQLSEMLKFFNEGSGVQEVRKQTQEKKKINNPTSSTTQDVSPSPKKSKSSKRRTLGNHHKIEFSIQNTKFSQPLEKSKRKLSIHFQKTSLLNEKIDRRKSFEPLEKPDILNQLQLVKIRPLSRMSHSSSLKDKKINCSLTKQRNSNNGNKENLLPKYSALKEKKLKIQKSSEEKVRNYSKFKTNYESTSPQNKPHFIKRKLDPKNSNQFCDEKLIQNQSRQIKEQINSRRYNTSNEKKNNLFQIKTKQQQFINKSKHRRLVIHKN